MNNLSLQVSKLPSLAAFFDTRHLVTETLLCYLLSGFQNLVGVIDKARFPHLLNRQFLAVLQSFGDGPILKIKHTLGVNASISADLGPAGRL